MASVNAFWHMADLGPQTLVTRISSLATFSYAVEPTIADAYWGAMWVRNGRTCGFPPPKIVSGRVKNYSLLLLNKRRVHACACTYGAISRLVAPNLLRS